MLLVQKATKGVFAHNMYLIYFILLSNGGLLPVHSESGELVAAVGGSSHPPGEVLHMPLSKPVATAFETHPCF